MKCLPQIDSEWQRHMFHSWPNLIFVYFHYRSFFSSRLHNVTAIERMLIQLEETERSFDAFWARHEKRLMQCLQLRRFEDSFRKVNLHILFTCVFFLCFAVKFLFTLQFTLRQHQNLTERSSCLNRLLELY